MSLPGPCGTALAFVYGYKVINHEMVGFDKNTILKEIAIEQGYDLS